MREHLRAALVAAPLAAGFGCGGRPLFYCPDNSLVPYAVIVPMPDGGVPGADGGLDCTAVCNLIDEAGEFYTTPGCSFITVGSTLAVNCNYTYRCVGGRRPPSLRPLVESVVRPANQIGDFFAKTARLEAAAVEAFRFLSEELEGHGAPPSLVSAAVRASGDEVRHAWLIGSLARNYGTAPLEPVFDAHAVDRGLAAISLENAVEGCVGETYGALLAMWQATHAEDPAVARTMGGIADDELAHAELAWAIARWAEPQLSDSERATVAQARSQALRELRDQASAPVDEESEKLAGLPRPEIAMGLVHELAEFEGLT